MNSMIAAEAPTVTRLYEQAVLAIPQNLRNVAYLCGDDRTAAGEGLTQDDRRGLGAQRSYHHHVARRINVGCVPAVSAIMILSANPA